MKLASLQDLLVEQLHDIYSAEKQVVRSLPTLVEAAQTPRLQDAFKKHLLVTERQVNRLERAFRYLHTRARERVCEGMQGLLAEERKLLTEEVNPSVRDAGLIAAAQRIEHYEIAAYGTVRTIASQLGLNHVAQLLDQTLTEEKEADRVLSEIAEAQVNLTAQVGTTGPVAPDEGEDGEENGEREEEDEEDDEVEPTETR